MSQPSRRRPTVFVVAMGLGLAVSARAALGAPLDATGTPAGPADAPEADVVGGTQVPAGKWPDAVALMSGGQGFCTGTLIAPDVVLTAGHCVGEGVEQVKIAATDNTGPGEVIAVTRVVDYPSWESTYDVAVLVLAQPSQTTPRAIATSCITDSYLVAGAPVQLVGYGATDIQGQSYNTQLREAGAAVIDPDCSNGDGCQAAVSPGGEMTAGGSGINSCYGDSGGPVYLPTPEGTFLAGVVSRGVDSLTAPCQGGGIYVRPDAVIDWVEQVSGRTVAKSSCDATPPDDGTGDDGGDADDGAGDGDEPDGDDDDGGFGGGAVSGGCQAGGGARDGGAALLAIALVIATRRRQRG